jgi:dipeptidyl aminopeptidase/acylaminoacyl peptidase
MLDVAGVVRTPADSLFIRARPKPAPKKPGLPLKAERKIKFTTDEATWLSLTLTPDGDYVLVSRKGNNTLHEVWMYTIQDGSGVQVTATFGSGQRRSCTDSTPLFTEVLHLSVKLVGKTNNPAVFDLFFKTFAAVLTSVLASEVL